MSVYGNGSRASLQNVQNQANQRLVSASSEPVIASYVSWLAQHVVPTPLFCELQPWSAVPRNKTCGPLTLTTLMV